MPETLIHANRLSKKRSKRIIFDDVSLTVKAGESLAVTGPSGSGKTTLINCLGLLDRVGDGRLELVGNEVTRLSGSARRRLLRHTVGHLFQHYGLVESWPVARNLDVGFIGQQTSRAERAERRIAALARVGLEEIGNTPTHVLSGGEQQRVALARLLLKKPRIVIADEPTAALDAENAAVVLSILGELLTSGCALVVATHDVGLENWCDARLNLGRADSPLRRPIASSPRESSAR